MRLTGLSGSVFLTVGVSLVSTLSPGNWWSVEKSAPTPRATLGARLNPNSDLGGAVGKAREVERTWRYVSDRLNPNPISAEPWNAAIGDAGALECDDDFRDGALLWIARFNLRVSIRP